VRNVPLFPEKPVAPGDTWSAPGWEVHDFRASYGMQDPFSFPITVSYTYLRDEVRSGIDCAVIGISYSVFQKLTAVPRTTRTYPVRLAGTSSQTLWWDTAAGRELAYTETFDFLFTLATGDEVEYVGESSGELIEATPLDRAAATAAIAGELSRQKVEGASVRADELGVTITLENVSFQANSDALLPSEQEKLRRIASILAEYPDRDILITGHTAGVPGYTAQQHQELSELRAKAVGDFLISLGARGADQITTRGMGVGFPIGDNATEEGRQRNRRVEITILEN
jgi:outer membrane protein OmpA-like peptidoglycan-associated protein